MDGAGASFRIDGYKFLPRSMIPDFKAFPYQADDVVRAMPVVSLRNARVALLTSGGLYLKHRQQSFDVERERREPFWGDPTYRVISRNVGHGEIDVAHLHLNPDDIVVDFNVALPLEVFAELERDGEIGSLAENNYSFMGYQGRSSDAWRDTYGPELARPLQEDGVNLLILAPT
jgi:D-proline reductase (dithiol) PrdB